MLARGDADLVSMARPMLADPELVQQGRAGARGRDQHLHRLQPGLPGPHLRRAPAGQLPGQPAGLQRDPAALPSNRWPRRKRIAVVGAGPAGLAASPRWRRSVATASRCSIRRGNEIGGQFNLAKRIPGKEEFHETLALLPPDDRRCMRIKLRLDTRVDSPRCCAPKASTRWWWPPASSRGAPDIDGHRPRQGGALHRRHPRTAGRSASRVAILGAGGIGFDVAELDHAQRAPRRRWTWRCSRASGASTSRNHPRGGVTGVQPAGGPRRSRRCG